MAEQSSKTVNGAHVIAQTLKSLGVTVIFGIVGVPVSDIAEQAINIGIRFIGFRNEQAASYAATAYGYLTGKPGVCLVVGGPGVLHAIAGVSQTQARFDKLSTIPCGIQLTWDRLVMQLKTIFHFCS
jgi:thiamine pyrophosphate-dependent acetolactate synthase large subunit-like protein